MKDRKKPRAIVRYPSKIIIDESFVDCILVDVSVTGARVHLGEDAEMPQKFLIHVYILPNTPPLILTVRRVWRQRSLAGIHFEELSRKDYLVLDSLIKVHRAEIMQNQT